MEIAWRYCCRKYSRYLARMFRNLAGGMFGYERCTFCGDRANWKSWVNTITVSDKKIIYEPPVCKDCFCSQPLSAVQNVIKADIKADNIFRLSLRVDPEYSDADVELIMDQVTQDKEVHGGVANSD